MSQWQAYLIAGGIGLLVGIEREKSHPSQQALGLRTFLLISLLGALARDLQTPWLTILISGFSLGLILISYFNQTRSKAHNVDWGLTTEFAAGIVFCLGYAARDLPALSALIGPLVAVILFSKKKLHHFTKALRPAELEAALLLFLGAVVVINLFPNAEIDPWGIFNPRKFGYLVLILAAFEFCSYLMAKVFGEKKGTLFVGFLGGFVSSTAVLLSSAKQAQKNPGHWRSPLSSTLASTLASYIELILIVGLISKELLLHLLPAIGPGILWGAIALFFASHKDKERRVEVNLKSPLDWKGVLRISLLFASILVVISLTKMWLGEGATLFVSLLTGSFELHGVSIANATMYSEGQLNLQTASLNILLALFASIGAKAGIGVSVGRGAFAKYLILALTPMMGIFFIVGWLSLGR